MKLEKVNYGEYRIKRQSERERVMREREREWREKKRNIISQEFESIIVANNVIGRRIRNFFLPPVAIFLKRQDLFRCWSTCCLASVV